MNEVRANFENMVLKYFESVDKQFDEKCGLIGVDIKKKNVIHTNVTGYAHYISGNAVYTQLVFMSGAKHRYAAAEEIINKIIDAQDTNPESRTCGLWAYYFEEELTEMSAPDYNMAEFVARPMIYILLEKGDLISERTAQRMKKALNLAARCCIRRNVGLDYTNVISMSCLTTMIIGEITGDDELREFGKRELGEFVEYTRESGGFSEYNSPCYFKVVGDSVGRILKYCRDEECRSMAEELNRCLWEMVSTHYSAEFNELAPPFVRAYYDTDVEFENTDFVYYATGGKYGKYHCSMNDWELNVPKCPEEFYENFEKELWLKNVYYKKNNLRKRNTDVTIVQDFDSPDLTAYTYKTKKYLFGALQKTDLWDQRRTSMVLWDKDSKKSFKLRCMKDGFSFSSAMAYTAMNGDEMLTVVGFSTDHGSKHYILDRFENGTIETESLKFTMKINGAYNKENFKRNGNELVYGDGKISFSVKVLAWVFDGAEGEVRFTDDGFELVCHDGESRTLNLSELKETYGVISMKINGEALNAEIEQNGMRVKASTEKFAIDTYSRPQDYNSCIRNTYVTD